MLGKRSWESSKHRAIDCLDGKPEAYRGSYEMSRATAKKDKQDNHEENELDKRIRAIGEDMKRRLISAEEIHRQIQEITKQICEKEINQCSK